jgi:PhzF family phenazine biosynthesis protein
MTEIFQVDAFAGKPFSGNPAAVCILTQPASEAWMQDVAAEMNLAETAFVSPEGDGFRLRWFTPTVEVELCGHATLATAHILWQESIVPAGNVCTFQSLSGPLSATQVDGKIQLDFPALQAVEREPPEALRKAIGAKFRWSGLSRHDWLVEVDSPDAVRGVRPDFNLLRGLGVRGVIVTAAGDGAPWDFVSRFFAPGAGIDEDPVTGSAHCVLGPYWSEKTGKSQMQAWQASARGGSMTVKIQGDRVLLQGNAITVFRGRMLV